MGVRLNELGYRILEGEPPPAPPPPDHKAEARQCLRELLIVASEVDCKYRRAELRRRLKALDVLFAKALR